MTFNYVPWDISFLTRFFTVIKDNIGVSVNTGLVILAVVVGIPLIIKLIKAFSKV